MGQVVKIRREARRELARRSDRELAAFERAGRLNWWGCVCLAVRCGLTVYREARAAGRKS
jgi:hypothetical protein